MDFEDQEMERHDSEEIVRIPRPNDWIVCAASAKEGENQAEKAADKVDMKAKLERSRQSARECRARKKLRYQYLEELVTDREKAVIALRKELDKYRSWGKELDEGRVPEGMHALLEEMGAIKQEK